LISIINLKFSEFSELKRYTHCANDIIDFGITTGDMQPMNKYGGGVRAARFGTAGGEQEQLTE